MMVCRALSNWRLYSWMRFTCESNNDRGHDLAGGRLEPLQEMRFGLALRIAEAHAESVVLGQRTSLLSCVRSVIQPSPMASVMRRASGGLGHQQPAPRRDTVGLVAEALGEHLHESGTTVVLSNSEWMAATPLCCECRRWRDWPCAPCAPALPR